MLVKTRAIVISAHKYQEKSLIIKCFTLSDGLKSYFVRDAFSKSKTAQKKAYFQLLNVLEIEAIHKNKGTLESFKEIKIAAPFHSIHNSIAKSMMVVFLSEILLHSIQEEEQNEQLFTFLEAALNWLDNHDEIANFHLILMIETTKCLGFYPDVTDIEFKYFELVEGKFAPFQAASSLSEHETKLFKKLLTLKFDNGQKTFHIIERQLLLKILIDYYAMHLDGFKRPKSLEILKEIFE